jgi:predicted AlkP superfamily phosphohydrolase/phosphomutase
MLLGYIDPGTGFTIVSFGGWLIALILGILGLLPFFFKKALAFIVKHKKWVFAIIILLVIIIGLTIIVSMDQKVSSFDNKIIILGFDGLSPKIIEPMMKNGELPNFVKLKQKGSYDQLSTTNPSQSPVAWSGFATGQNPGKNGVFDFIVRDPKNYKLSLSLSNIINGRPRRVIQSKCFWQYTSEEKVPTTILGCPVSFPPDKIDGKMLSGMGVPDILGTEGTFTFYTSETLKKDKDIGGKVFRINKSPLMIMHLIGPKVAGIGRKTENTKVPFKAALKPDRLVIEFQNNKCELAPGQWSDWQEVTFKLGLFKKAKGIFKFYLVELEPEIKLYVSPINFDPRDPFFTISYPKAYSRELAEEIGLYYTQGMPVDTWAVNEKRLPEKAHVEQIHEVLKEKEAMLELELGQLEKGVLFCYFETPDIVQHMFWRYTDPQHPLYKKDAPAEYRNMIRTWYKKMDRILGRVMGQLGPEDTLIVLSDHGFDTFRRSVHINTWLWDHGYLELKDFYAESGAELLADIDWEQTSAYAIGFGAIYINQQGREKEGIIEAGEEAEELKTEIANGLERWMDKKYGQPVVNKVYRKEEIFQGDRTKDMPDLYVGFNPGYRASWQTALGGVPGELIEDNLKKWSGSHLFDPALIPGIIFSNRKITKTNPSIYDIAPTIVKTIGFEEEKIKKCDFDGTPLF